MGSHKSSARTSSKGSSGKGAQRRRPTIGLETRDLFFIDFNGFFWLEVGIFAIIERGKIIDTYHGFQLKMALAMVAPLDFLQPKIDKGNRRSMGKSMK